MTTSTDLLFLTVCVCGDCVSIKVGQRCLVVTYGLVIIVRCIFVYVYFPHLLGGFLHILTCTCNYMLWPLTPWEYNLSIPNMVSEQ
jgi:hypothetical protein